MGEKDWYNNKELYEMIDTFKQEVMALNVEMKETKVLIRDYNGLRESIAGVNSEITSIKTEMKTYEKSKKEYIGYVIAGVSIIFTLLNYLK